MNLNLARIIAGVLLLLLGRRLFWMFVGLVGFWAGMTVAKQFLTGQSDLVVLVVAIVAGILGVVLAIFLQRLAIALAGFLSAGYFCVTISHQIAWMSGYGDLVVFLIGGVLGAILLTLLFDWALIFLSSASGAILIAETVQAHPPLSFILFFVLFIVGFAIQAGMLVRKRRVVVTE